MFASSKSQRRWIRACCGLVVSLAAGLVAIGRVPAQESKPEPAKAAQSEKAGASRQIDPGLDQKINQAREEIDILELQLETKKRSSISPRPAWRRPGVGRNSTRSSSATDSPQRSASWRCATTY